MITNMVIARTPVSSSQTAIAAAHYTDDAQALLREAVGHLRTKGTAFKWLSDICIEKAKYSLVLADEIRKPD